MTLIFKTLLAAHLFSDFYIQIQNNNEKKNYLIKNLFIYPITFLFICINTFSKINYISIIIFLLIHLLIKIIIKFLHTEYKLSNIPLYLTEQSICILLLLYYSYRTYPVTINLFKTWLINLCNKDIFILEQYISWLLLIIAIIQPASVTIKILLTEFQPHTSVKKKNDILIKQGRPNAGAFIGILERILILLMLSIKEYSSIGLVITAKSVVRYKKISEDPEFSEYYLLGTLLSTILVILFYLLIIPS